MGEATLRSPFTISRKLKNSLIKFYLCLVSNRHVDNSIHVEDLDDLQLEMEELLAFATQRLCKVKAEFKAVSDLQDNKKEKKLFKGVKI